MTRHPLNGLPYGTLRRAPGRSFAHALLLDQPDEKCWHLVDLYGPTQGDCVSDAEVADWPIVYTPIEDEEWEFQTTPVSPPFTAQEKCPLRNDHNYHFQQSDREIDRLARTQPHGHVTPNDNGRVAKCGGPNGPCGVCRREAEILAFNESVGSDEQPST